MSTSPLRLPRTLNRWGRGLLLASLLLPANLALVPAAQASPARQGDQVSAIQADNFEDDDQCSLAKAITTDGVEQQRNLDREPGADLDWVKFDTTANVKYAITATADGADADLIMELHQQCDSIIQPLEGKQLTFKATSTRSYNLLVKHKLDTYGPNTSYRLKITTVAQPPSTIALAQLPPELMRRAADFVEQMRGSELAPNWKEARFTDPARILYRPDISGPAYYDLPLEAPDATGAYKPAGFVQLSASDHDYPITHWNVDGESPTQSLDTAAALNDQDTTQYYKLDVLSYVAEADEPSPLGVTVPATDVIRLGTLPTKISKLEALPLDDTPQVTEVNWSSGIANDDSVTQPVSGTLEIKEPEAAPLSLDQESWASWEELKTEYGETYSAILGGLKQDAQSSWSETKALSQRGEGLIKGDVRTVRGLPGLTVASFKVEGAGAAAQYLQQDKLTGSGLPDGVQLTVLKEPEDTQTALPISVTVQYNNNTSETTSFVIVSSLRNAVFMPVLSSPGSNQVAAADATASSAIHGAWGPWSYWWAGTHNDQRLYDQIAAYTFNNNTPCWSGCGATAWAMLFGWADFRASVPGSGWNHRFGIYRQNGGYGADAVAPKFLDAGIRNIQMEIRNYIKTYCNNGSGWTKSDTMHEAWRYLSGRSGASIHSKFAGGWWIFGTSEEEVRNYAIGIVKSGRPAVIGRQSHFPLAYGYAEQTRRVSACAICWWDVTEYNRWFYVNQGWGGSSNGWVSAEGTWFAGEIRAN